MARELIGMGFHAAALKGGFNAWRASYPVEPKDLSGANKGLKDRAVNGHE